MSSVTFKNLNKIYPNGFVSVKNVSLHIEDEEFVTFHGPSGCGKSTILRMIGGLEDISTGEIYLGDDLLNDILPRDRRLSMAFQNYGLYSYFNVYDNMSLGLKLRNLPRSVIETRVRAAAEFLGVADVLDKRIKSVSDAAKQKVALGRAIVCHPKVLLVDEDFSRQNEDRRREMIEDIQRINKDYKITVLYVTNDPSEAATLGNRVVYMREGEITEIVEISGGA